MPEIKFATEGQMIAALIAEKGYDRREFAELAGVSEDVLSNIIRGITRLKSPRRQRFAAMLGITEQELRLKLSEPEATIGTLKHETINDAHPIGSRISTVNVRGKVIIVPTGMKPVFIFGTAPAGVARGDYSQADDVEMMPEWSGDFERWGRFVSGDSMMPEFQDRDIVIFENRRPLPGQAVYAERDGEFLFKVLHGTPDEGFLWSMNREYKPVSATGWNILGTLVQRVRYTREGLRDTRDYPSHFTFGVSTFK